MAGQDVSDNAAFKFLLWGRDSRRQASMIFIGQVRVIARSRARGVEELLNLGCEGKFWQYTLR